MAEVCVVGAGLAGLACARELAAHGHDVVVVEASTRVGGRVATDLVDGRQVDLGFQILLTAYPEARRVLDYEALDLRRFEPGALVHVDGRFHRVADPIRRPRATVSTLRAPIGTLTDKARVLRLVASVRRPQAAELLRGPDRSTRAALETAGFSERIVDRFFTPLFSGIQFDPDLEVSARRFAIILRMLATGDAAVPAAGMGAVPAQLASAVGPDRIRLGTPVSHLEGTTAVLADGERIAADAIVVATDGPTAARLVPECGPVAGRRAACLWFATPEPTGAGRTLVLDGDRSGPVANLAELSAVAPAYAPGGHLVAAAVPVGTAPAPSDGELLDGARRQLRRWFGAVVDRWEVVALQQIEHAHPDQRPGFSPKRSVDLGDGRFVCGDHRDTASIQGALFSGRRCARAVGRFR